MTRKINTVSFPEIALAHDASKDNGVNSGDNSNTRPVYESILSQARMATSAKVQRLGAESHADSNAPTSAPPEREDIVRASGRPEEAGVKLPGVNTTDDLLDTTPQDGMTAAFFNYGQWSVPIAISGKEERENKASATQAFNLLKAKTKQGVLGIQEGFARAFIQGNGPNTATAIATAFTSVPNGSVFIDPLPLLVKYDPTTSTTIGNINQSTYSWWRNQTKNSTSTTFAGFLKEMDNLYNSCSKGPGGPPDLNFVDQNVYELYVAALRNQNRYVDYKKADLPFDTVGFHSNAVTWDQFVPDAQNETITSIPVASAGTWYMLNTQFFQIKYFLNFEATPFIKPENQDAKVATMLWHGGAGVSNRRKHGVAGGIDTAISS